MWGRVKNAVSKPVRGIGRIARGKFREGMGDIGEGLEAAGPALHAIPGVGTAAAIGLQAGGAAMNRMGQEGANFGSVAGSAGRGAAQGGASALGGAAIGKIAGGAGGAAAEGIGDELAGSAVDGIGDELAGEAAQGLGSRFGGWVSENPELAGDIAGTGLEAYGAHKDDKARQRAWELEEEERRQRMGADAGSRRAAGRILNRRRGAG
jgi:hypothetical protein